MKNSPEILALSNDAQAVLAGHFMFGTSNTLQIGNIESRLNERGEKAMQELIDAGLLQESNTEDGNDRGRIYRLTEKCANLSYRKSLDWMSEHGKFSVMEKIPEEERVYTNEPEYW
jgi:hypothetical protein